MFSLVVKDDDTGYSSKERWMWGINVYRFKLEWIKCCYFKLNSWLKVDYMEPSSQLKIWKPSWMQLFFLDLEFLSWVWSMRNDLSEIAEVKTGICTLCMVNLQPQACLLVALFPTSWNCVFMQALFQFHVAWFHVPLVSLRAQALNKPQTPEWNSAETTTTFCIVSTKTHKLIRFTLS